MKEVDVLNLWDRFDHSDVSEMTFSQGDMTFSLKRATATPSVSVAEAMDVMKVTKVKTQAASANLYIKSPMVGTFYRAAAPDEEPFVSVGQSIKKGDVVGIVESMKMMNEILADCDGVVESIEVSDGDLVEFEQPLIGLK